MARHKRIAKNKNTQACRLCLSEIPRAAVVYWNADGKDGPGDMVCLNCKEAYFDDDWNQRPYDADNDPGEIQCDVCRNEVMRKSVFCEIDDRGKIKSCTCANCKAVKGMAN